MSADEVRLPLASVAHPDHAFAASMARLRIARGWGVQRLADEAGVNAGAVYRLEAGRGGCYFTTVWLIAEALEVPVDAMVRGEIP